MELTEQQKAQQFLMSIYKKAWEDDEFKKNLIENPLETLNEFTGKEADIPDGTVLVVEDQTNSNHIYLNIPAKPDNFDDIELSDSQLEDVAGAAGAMSSAQRNNIVHSIKKVIQNWS